MIDTATLIKENGRLVGLLTDEQQYAQILSITLLAVGHHNQAKHQGPDDYDSESSLACVIPRCLEEFVKAFVDDGK